MRYRPHFLAPVASPMLAAVTTLAFALLTHTGLADAATIEPDADEKSRLEACEKTICHLVNKRAPSEGKTTCSIGKTWDRTKIEKGAKKSSLKWGFGDAKCALEVSLSNSHVVRALTKSRYKIFFKPHTIRCKVVTSEGIEPVTVKLAPKLKFRDGKVRKIDLKVKEVEAPSLLKGLIWSTVGLEKALGVFQREMVKEVNEFLHDKCPARHGS